MEKIFQRQQLDYESTKLSYHNFAVSRGYIFYVCRSLIRNAQVNKLNGKSYYDLLNAVRLIRLSMKF